MGMKHINIRRWLLAALALPALLATGQPTSDTIPAPQNQLSVDVQFLARGESRYGGLKTEVIGIEDLDDEEEEVAQYDFIQGRTRLVINYRRDWLDARLTPQHSGVWGQSGKGSFNLYETWVRLTAPFGLFVQAGRVALSYDDERIIGSDNWAMASLSHDVLRVGYEGHGHKAHVVLAYNQNAEVMATGDSYYQNGGQPYKTMLDLWYHYDFSSIPLGASLLFMNIGMQNEPNSPRHTWFQHLLGGYVSFAPHKWRTEFSYYHQFGKNETGIKIDAWMASAKVGFSPFDKLKLTAGYDYLSGDDKFAVPPRGGIGVIRHEVIKGFSTVYGSHHKFYGAMDFFYVSAYLNGFTPGLQNAYLIATYNPIKQLSLSGGYHYLATATKLNDMGMRLGHEVELQANYAFTPDVNVSAGLSMMKGSDTMERLKRASNNNRLRWVWLSLSVNPRIFTTKW